MRGLLRPHGLGEQEFGVTGSKYSVSINCVLWCPLFAFAQLRLTASRLAQRSHLDNFLPSVYFQYFIDFNETLF
ncbi:hypothetical protein DPMN_054764 [Dreissena polymorpha]|uniref:Uncharacterized protein n=1 Tax=Dreissena polymorpha TaxID=45954 RepID=A0A9D4HQ23_DREPO|nr:hypothetical protein DPMN_054764 [Dreissena polymorpha]